MIEDKRFKLLVAETLESLIELLNVEEKYYTIREIREYGRGYAALIDRMPVELMQLYTMEQESAYESPDMA